MGPFPKGENELLWQIRRAYCFNWASSGLFLELMIHQIDECCWIKDGWPVTAHGVGGRAANSQDASQNLDSYSIEYTFADGTKAMVTGRYISNCYNDFATFVHGTKCAAQFSGNIHAPTVQTYKDQRIAADNVDWKPEPERVNPWQAEWNSLLDDIRNDRPHNEAKRAAYSTLAAIMGRAAVHSGKIITWDEAMASRFFFCQNVSGLTKDSPAPVQADKNGCYAPPVPGAYTEI
jgi:predicted dehydrogenase